MDANRLIVVFVGVELLTLALLWIIARAGAHRLRRVSVQAPHDPTAQQEIRRRVQYRLEVTDRPERGVLGEKLRRTVAR